MTFRQLCGRLAPLYGDREARAVVLTLLDDVFGLTLADVCGSADLPLKGGAADEQRLAAMMQRLEAGVPVQQVSGQATFGGRQFAVTPDVLIPRPETWQLCTMAVERRPRQVLDIGTGSGCIAVSIALDAPGAQVTAWDISPSALRVAESNARRLGAAVSFVLQDALQPPADDRRWDVVVSNPPYICDSERRDMAPNVVDHEPAGALFVPDDDPLRFYRPIASYARRALRPGGSILLECNTRFAEATAELLRTLGFAGVSVESDLFGLPRFAVGQRFD